MSMEEHSSGQRTRRPDWAALLIAVALVAGTGALIDFLHLHIDAAQGALLNPAGLTQHGVPLHDAIKAMPFPVIEVHISQVHKREAFRHHSYVSLRADGVMAGFGVEGYALAVRRVCSLLAN